MKKFFILTVILIVSCVICTTFFLSVMHEMNDTQKSYCEAVIRDVYAQDTLIREIPDGVAVSITDTTITVMINRLSTNGKVTAKLQNGELVYQYDSQSYAPFVLGALFGALMWCIVLLGIAIKEKMAE